MVDMGEYAIYASHYGLVAVSQTQATLITENVLSREYWQSLLPTTIHAYRYHDYYVAFYNDTSGFCFNVKTGDYFELDFYADAGFFDTKAGNLFLLVGDNFVTFDNGGNLNYLWHSKDFELSGAKFSAVKIRGENLTGTRIQIFIDEVSIMDTQLLGSTLSVFRLPAFRADKLTFEITGTGEIKTIAIASTMAELANA